MSVNDPKRLRRTGDAGLLAGVAGLAAVGTIAGVTVARSMTRRTTATDLYPGEQPEIIDDALVRLVEHATPSKLVALNRRTRDRARLHG